MAGFLPPVIATLTADTREFTAGMAKARGEMTATTTHGTTSFQKLASFGKAAFIGIGTAAIAAGALSVKAALEGEAAHARLTSAVKNTGTTYDAYKSRIEALNGTMAKLGFENDDVESSLATLTNATHNTGKAIDLMGLAADIARGRHIDLSTAVGILAKVETGHVALLGRLGINTKDATGATISQEEAVKRLAAVYGGNASAYTQTFSGKMEVLKAELHNTEEVIGQKLLPVLASMASAVGDVVGWLDRNREAAAVLAAVVSGPLVAAMTVFAATKIISTIQGITSALFVAKGAVGAFGTSLTGLGFASVTLAAIAAAYALYKIGTAANKTTVDVEALSRTTTRQLVTAFQDAAETFGKLDGGSKGDIAREKLALFRKVAEGNIGTAVRLKEGLEAAGESTAGYGKIIDDVTRGQKQLNTDTQRGTGLVDKYGNNLDGAATSAKDMAKALHAAHDEVQRLSDKILDVNDASRGMQDALRQITTSLLDVHDKQVEYNDAVAKYGPKSEQAIRASLDLQAAQQAVGQAVDDTKRAIEELAAKQAGATSAADAASNHTAAYIANLKNLAGHLAPGSALRVWLEQYIAALNAIPPAKTTTISTIVSTTYQTHGAPSGVKRYASGGNPSNEWAWVGERGPELVKFGGGGAHVFTASQSKNMTSRGGSGGGITVTGPITIVANNPNQIADALKRHVRTHGGLAGTNLSLKN